MKKSLLLLITASACFYGPAFAAPPIFRLSLKDAERMSLAHSPQFQSSKLETEAALARSKSEFALLWPRVSFDGNYRHVSEVPAFKPVPTAPEVKLGDNKNYSYGPSVTWQIWDSGFLYNRWRSAQASA